MRSINEVDVNETFSDILYDSIGGGLKGGGDPFEGLGILLQIGSESIQIPVPADRSEAFLAVLMRHQLHGTEGQYEVVDTESDKYKRALTIAAYKRIHETDASHVASSEGPGASAAAAADVTVEGLQPGAPLLRVHPAPMVHRDGPSGLRIPTNTRVFTFSSGTTRDVIKTEYHKILYKDDERRADYFPHGRLATGDEAQVNAKSSAGRVYPLIGKKLSELPQATLKTLQNIHIIKDKDGVSDIKGTQRNVPLLYSPHSRNPGETVAEFRARLEQEGKTADQVGRAISYDAYLTAFDDYFHAGQPLGPVNLEAAEYGAYQCDEHKIGRLINAILNEDYPERVHVLIDDKEDILTAVYNFFKRYPQLMQGKLVCYKAQSANIKDRETRKVLIPEGKIALCQWTEDATGFCALKSDAEDTIVVSAFAEFSEKRRIEDKDKTDFVANDGLHADWGAYLVTQVATDAQRRFDKPDAEMTAADSTACVRGTATEAMEFRQQHRLVSMMNAIYLAIEENEATKAIDDGVQRRLTDHEKIRKRLERFQHEIEAAHFRLRHDGESDLQLPEGLGHIAIMAAMTTRKIAQTVFDHGVDLSESSILQEFLQHFPCDSISASLRELLIEAPTPNIASSRSVVSRRSFHSRRSRADSSRSDTTVVEMHDTASGAVAADQLMLTPWDQVEVSVSINTWAELTSWLDSIGINPSHFQQYVDVSAADTSLGKEPLSVVRPIQKILQQYYIQTNGGTRFIFKSFNTTEEEVYDDMEAATMLVAGRPTFAWMVPQRREDGYKPKTYNIKNAQSTPTRAIVFPVDASAETQSRWRGFGANAATELATSRAALKKQFAEIHFTEDHFGDHLGLTNDDWMVTVARKLLPGFVAFKNSANGQAFFSDLVSLLNLPERDDRLHTVQNMWQIMLQALETGWPQMMVTIPSGHRVEWYEQLYALCKTTIFIKPECRGLVRNYKQIDIQTMMVSKHEQCVFRQATEASILDRFNRMFARATAAEPQEFGSPLVDALVARFADINPTMHSSSRLVTTPEHIAAFLQEMVANVTSATTAVTQCKARQYGLALHKLCALPIKHEDYPNAFGIISYFNVLGSLQQDESGREFRASLARCTQVFNACLPSEYAAFINVDSLQALFDLDADEAGITSFRSAVLNNAGLLSILQYYTQPTTMPTMFGRDRGVDDKRIEIANPSAYESTPDLFAKLVRDLIKANSQSTVHQQVLYIIFIAVLQFPFNINNNKNIRAPEKLEASMDAEARFHDLQVRIESLLLACHVTSVEMHAFYQIVAQYHQAIDDDCNKFNKVIYNKSFEVHGFFDKSTYSWLDQQAHKERRSILFEAIVPHLPASVRAAVQEQKSDIDDFIIDISPNVDEPAMQALRHEWQTTRESSHDYICSSKNWQEFFERVALRYFDTRIPTTRWEKMHQWWELVLTALPPISAGLAAQVLKEMEADVLGNSTTPSATTMSADSSEDQLNRPITIAWIVLGSLVFAERLAATVGFSPQKPAIKRLWRHATWAVELTLALGAMGAASVVAAIPANNTDYLSNLALSMGKAHAGAAMIGHANGFAMLIAPLVMMIGCTPTLKNIINKSSRTLMLMGFLSAGAILSSNPIGSAVFTIGSYSQPFILAIQAAGNFVNSVLPTVLGTGLALGIGAAFIFASYRIPPAYKAFAGLIFAMGLGLTGVSVANFAVPLSDYISGATTQIPEWVAFIVAHSNEFVWGTVGAAALMVVLAVTVVECTRQEKAPSYFPREVACVANPKTGPRQRERSFSSNSSVALRVAPASTRPLIPGDDGANAKLVDYGGTSTTVRGPGQSDAGNE